MSRWFRVFDTVLDDPKVQKLAPEVFKGWVNLLCLASRTNGSLPGISEIAFALRISDDAADALVLRLCDAGLLDDIDGHLQPHKWHERQFFDKTNAARQKRYRNKQKHAQIVSNALRNVTVTPVYTDTDTDTERKNISVHRPDKPPGKRARNTDLENPRFEEFWAAYPKRQGSNPRQPASVKFSRYVSAGIDAQEIISGAARYRDACDKDGTEPQFVAQAQTWLNQQRWRDYGAPDVALADGSKVPAFADDAEFNSWWQKRMAGNG